MNIQAYNIDTEFEDLELLHACISLSSNQLHSLAIELSSCPSFRKVKTVKMSQTHVSQQNSLKQMMKQYIRNFCVSFILFRITNQCAFVLYKFRIANYFSKIKTDKMQQNTFHNNIHWIKWSNNKSAISASPQYFKILINVLSCYTTSAWLITLAKSNSSKCIKTRFTIKLTETNDQTTYLRLMSPSHYFKNMYRAFVLYNFRIAN